MKSFLRRYTAALDMGSSKLCCWVGQENPGGELRLVGCGYMGAKGIWGGQFTDISSLQEAIVATIYEAEQQSGQQVRQAYVTLSSAFFSHQVLTLDLPIQGEQVSDLDIKRLYSHIESEENKAIHVAPLEFRVDQQGPLKDPRGIVGKKLKAQFHVSWIDKSLLKTLQACLKRCQIDMLQLIEAPYAHVSSCVMADEQELGVCLIDMGASATSVSLFVKGVLVSCTTFPIGGHRITQDIARGCDTPLIYAERIKILYGAAVMLSHDRHETVPLVPMGDWESGPSHHIPRSFLITIIQARAQEILNKIKEHLAVNPYQALAQRVILTGGGSQMPGIKDLAQRTLGRSIRIARPKTLDISSKLAREQKYTHRPILAKESPEFSAVIGSLLYQKPTLERLALHSNKFLSLFSWIKKKM